ncbi:MAG: hypothetical protein CVT77_13155 [Alphaproteobacteria bacterium HGW-Alphaproteobacteria-16]|nr:MAG: hypothetical protein CVT77_13155 [Alphaproteobacteria bacterium HGW-Alphaproteobacteria-16]
MHKIPANAVTVVTAETRSILQATDAALLAHAQMLASVVEGVSGSDLPINLTQDIYARIVAHGSKIVEGREDLKQLIARLTHIKNVSDQREMASGCPNELPDIRATPDFFTGATLETELQPG